MPSSTCRTLSAIMVFRRPLSSIEDLSLLLTFGNNYINVWVPISSKVQHIILRLTARPREWTKSLKTCSPLVFWMMVWNRTNTFHWKSSPTITVTYRALRCHILKHSMDDPAVPRWVGPSQARELSLAPISWQRQKRRWSRFVPTYWLPNLVKRATLTRDGVP
jgi:hypothetical protein